MGEFGLTEEKASGNTWQDDVKEGRDAFMIRFFEEEDRKSNARALSELPFYPDDPNTDSKIAASYLRILSELPFFPADPEVAKSNKQALLELPFYAFTLSELSRRLKS